jgi:predicted nucleotidyltransferase
LQKIKQAVIEADPSAEVILFGSQARGDAHEESDWDVLIVTDQTVTRDYKSNIRKRFYELQVELGISIGSLFVDKQIWKEPTAMPVFLELRKDGILL